jgi:DnaJ-class molecular chaperone
MDHYKVLESTKEDSSEKIKENYKRLILRHHPDKNDGNAERFIEINNAYKSIKQRHKNKLDGMTSKYAFDIARNYMMMMYLILKPRNINLTMSVRIEDLYGGVIKKINYMRFKKNIKQKDSVFIDLRNFKFDYVFEACGDENYFTGISGDLNVCFTIDYGNFDNLYMNTSIDLYDLSMKTTISLSEYYYGCNKEIIFINKKLNIDFHKPFRDGLILSLPYLGLPFINIEGKVERGNLILIIDVNLQIKREIVENDNNFSNMLHTFFK